MNKFTLAVISSGIVVSVAIPAAHAQGFKIRKDALEQVDWFHGKRQAQIVDDGIEVRDLRRRKCPAPYVEIQLAPIDTQPGYAVSGAAGTSPDSSIPAGGIRIGKGSAVSEPADWKTSLPQSGFGQSYISPKQMQLRPLQPGYNTGVHASLMQARQAAVTESSPRRLANRGDYIKPPLKSYPQYNSITSSTKYNYSGQVHGKLMRGSLINSK